ALDAVAVPVDLARVEHRVAAPADVDEGSLHRRQDVLHPAEVDVADQGVGGLPVHVVLDQDAVLQDGDLGKVLALPDDHLAVDGFASGQELGLADDRCAAAPGFASLAAALALGLHPGRSVDAGDLVGCLPRFTYPDHGVGRVVRRAAGVLSAATPTTAT